MHRIAVYLRMDIWRQIREDREKGAERLVSEYGNRLFAAAILLCGNEQDAEELTFRTLDQAVKKIRLYDAKKTFFTWLYAILLNFHRMNHRRRRVETVPMGTAEDLPEVVADTFGAAISQTADDTVAGAVRSLSPPLREVVMLYYFADHSVEEIAAMLNVPEGTVKSRLHNAREELSRFFSERRKGKSNDRK